VSEDSHGGAHRTVGVDGLRWHLVEAGDPAAVTIVLVAGFPQSAYAWRHVIPLLARDHHVIAVDLPGQGYTPATPGGYDTTTTARRVHALTEALGLGQHVYIGHDIGAWVGYAYAHLYPEDLHGVSLIDANIAGVTLPPTIALGPDSWRSWHFLFNAIDDLPGALLAGRERILIEWFLSHKSANWRAAFSPADLDEYERVYARPGGLRGMLGYYRAVAENTSQNAAFARTPISIPVLALGADQGSAPDLTEKLKPLCTDLRGDLITDSGHYIPEEQPEALTERLTAFVKEITAASS
jgi:pimeloyl-ACP methyl ester carboxylesterase